MQKITLNQEFDQIQSNFKLKYNWLNVRLSVIFKAQDNN